MDETTPEPIASDPNAPASEPLAEKGPAAGVAAVVTDLRGRVEDLLRNAVGRSSDVAGQVRGTAGGAAQRSRTQIEQLQSQVRDQLGRAVQETKQRSTQARDTAGERLGDARGRVQPVVEQVSSHAQRVVGASIDRARSLAGRDDTSA